MKVKILISIICFIFLSTSLGFFLSKMVTPTKNFRDHADRISNFYEEPKNSIDVVFIGPSSTFTSWVPLVAWKEYGITSLVFASSDLPNTSIKYIIKDIKKLINPKVIVIYADGMKFASQNQYYTESHKFLQYMKISPIRKFIMIKDIKRESSLNFLQSLELYFPVIRFHNQWKYGVLSNNLHPEIVYHKGILKYYKFYYIANSLRRNGKLVDFDMKNKNYSELSLVRDNYYYDLLKVIFLRYPLNTIRDEAFYNFFDKFSVIVREKLFFSDLAKEIKTINIPILMVATPSALYLYDSYLFNMQFENFEEIKKEAQEHGIEYINMKSKNAIDVMGLHRYDFWDETHLNYIGAYKFTKYFGNLLKNKYNLEDKRNNKEYSSWNDTYQEYLKIIKQLYDIDLEEKYQNLCNN